MATVSYGPYYKSELRALQAQRRAVSGKEAFTPSEMEGIVQGELAARYNAERSRQSELRNYNLQRAAGQREQTRIGMEAERMRQEERAAKIVGAGEALKWMGMGWGRGIAPEPTDGSRITLGPQESTTPTPSGQERAIGIQPEPTGVSTRAGVELAGSAVTGIGAYTANPLAMFAGAVLKTFAPVVAPALNSAYRSLFGPEQVTPLGGTVFGPAPTMGGVFGQSSLFGYGPTATLGEGALFGPTQDITFGRSPGLNIDYGPMMNLSFRDYDTTAPGFNWGTAWGTTGSAVEASGGGGGWGK